MPQPNDNIDPAEVDRFSAQSEGWWQSGGGFKALHQINPLRLAYVHERAGLKDRHVLDVGCGGGLLSEAMARQGARVTGIDMAETALSAARAHAAERGLPIEYHRSSAESWVAGWRARYEVVTCMELVEHVPDPASLVQACADLAAPQAHVFFATVNRTWLSRLLVIGAAEHVLGIVPKGTHQYRRFARPAEMIQWAAAAGLQKMDLSGVRFLPFIGYVRLCRDTRMNYLLHFRKRDT